MKSEKIFTVARYFLLTSLFFLPLLFPPIFLDIYDLPKILFFYFFSFILIALVCFGIYQQKYLLLPSKNFFMLLFLFVLIYIISTIFSTQPLISLVGLWDLTAGPYTGGLIYLLVLVLLFLSIGQLKESKNFLYELTVYLNASAFLVSFYGIYQYLEGFPNLDFSYRITSTIGETNRLAFFMVSILPLSFVLFMRTRKKVLKILSFLNLFLIMVAIILTVSRAGWIVVFLLATIGFFLERKRLKNILVQNKYYLLLGLCLFLLIGSGQINRLALRLTAVLYDLKNQSGSTYIRLSQWQTSLVVFKNQSIWRKLIGSGPETLKFTYLHYRPAFFNQFYPDKYWQLSQLRQQYLHYLNTIGVIGLTIYLAITIYIIWACYQTPSKNIYQQGFFYAWLAIVLSSIFYYQTTITHVFFWVFTAIIIQQKRVLKAKIIPGVLIITCLAGLALTSIVCVSLAFAKQRSWERSVRLTPFFDFLWREYSWQLQTQAFSEKNQKLALESIEIAQKAFQLNQLDPNNLKCFHSSLYRAAGYLGMSKNYQKQALKVSQKWVELDPSNPESWDALGLSYLDFGQLEPALVNFKKAISVDDQNITSYLHAGETLKQMGKIDQAISYYEQALKKTPDSSPALQELQKAKDLLDKQK